jgi:hypothetical protein
MPRQRVLLGTTLLPASTLRNHVRNGLGALPQAHRNLVAQDLRRHVGDSLDFDNATRADNPNANRWDYLLSVPNESKVVGLEPHTARDDQIRVVIAKKEHTAQYLRNHLLPRHRPLRWFWVTSGRVGFSRMERAIRQLNQAGIAFEGRLLSSFN